MGAIGAIMKYGSENQKKMAAGIVLAGDKPAICITEPGAGSAATEMTTTAVKKGDRYIINGKKYWITGGGVSKLHLVFARVMERGQSQGIAGFIVVRDETPGLSIPHREPTLGLRVSRRRRSSSKTWKSPRTWWSSRLKACAGASPA